MCVRPRGCARARPACEQPAEHEAVGQVHRSSRAGGRRGGRGRPRPPPGRHTDREQRDRPRPATPRTARPRTPRPTPRRGTAPRTAPRGGPAARRPALVPSRGPPPPPMPRPAITSSPAAPPPPSPTRSSTTKSRNAPGGWAPTCVVQNQVWPGSTAEVRMCAANSRSSTVSAGARGTSCRYSSVVVRRPTTPRCQPSTSASAHRPRAPRRPRPAPAARRHDRRSASAGPRVTTATATTTAGGVPGPTCGSHSASSGGKGRNRWTPSASRRRPTTAAATHERARRCARPRRPAPARPARDRRSLRIPCTSARIAPLLAIMLGVGGPRPGPPYTTPETPNNTADSPSQRPR